MMQQKWVPSSGLRSNSLPSRTFSNLYAMTEVADGTDDLKAWVKASFEAGITAAISTLGNVVDAELQKISKRIEPFELMGQAMEEELVPLRGLNAELVDTRVALQEQLANLIATVADHCARQKLCDIECVEALSPAAALISKSKARRMRRTNCAQQHQWSRELLLTARNPAERDSTDIAAATLIPAGVTLPAWPEQSSIEQRIHNLEVLAVASASHFAPVVPTPILADQSGTAGGHGAVEWGPWQSCTTYQEDWFASDAWEVLQQEFQEPSPTGHPLRAEAHAFAPAVSSSQTRNTKHFYDESIGVELDKCLDEIFNFMAINHCLASSEAEWLTIAAALASPTTPRSLVTATPPPSANPCTSNLKFYAVRQGRVPGVYDSWAAMVPHISGFERAEFSTFKTRLDAEAWLCFH